METVVSSQGQLRELTQDDALLGLYSYWDGKRAERLFPSRRDIDPLEFTFALSRVSLVDVIDEPERYRYRLVSTTLTRRLGYEMTGKYVRDIPDVDIRRYVMQLYGRAIEARAPLFEKSTRIHDDKVWQHQALLLPLASEGDKIDMLAIYRHTDHPTPLPLWARVENRPRSG